MRLTITVILTSFALPVSARIWRGVDSVPRVALFLITLPSGNSYVVRTGCLRDVLQVTEFFGAGFKARSASATHTHTPPAPALAPLLQLKPSSHTSAGTA